MKQVFSLIISGFAGGLIVLVGIILMDDTKLPTNKRTDAQFAHLETMLRGTSEDFVQAAQHAMPAVVHISASESVAMARNRSQQRSRDPFSFFFGDEGFFGGPRTRAGKGSGVIISSDGYIITNNHVIDFADEFEVTLHDNRKYKAVMIGQDPRTDLAVIKVDAQGLPHLSYGDSDEIEVGEWVLAVGNPFDLTSTVTAGIVSAKGRDNIIRRNDAIEDFIQTDAVVNPGNSGGALVNAEGKLIGVNTAIATATGYYAGYSFAIPSNMVQPVIDNIIDHGGPRGRIGLSIAAIADYEESEEIDLGIDRGVVVTKVEDRGAAQYAGIIPGDVIIKIDDEAARSPEVVADLLSQRKIGDQVAVTLMREGRKRVIDVRLKAD